MGPGPAPKGEGFTEPSPFFHAVERGLHQRINDLTAELHRVTEEKDRYWRVIEKK